MSKLKKGIIIPLGVIGITILMQSTLLETGIRAAEFNIPAPAIVNLNTATLNVPGTITVANSGTLQASTGTITVSNNGNWSNSGTFTPGTQYCSIYRDVSRYKWFIYFYNLKCEISSGAVTFGASNRQTISNSLTLKGSLGNFLSLRSSTSGTQWELFPQGTTDIDFVDVKDSNNLGSSRIQPTNWTDSGNNTAWGSAPTPPEPPPPVVTLTISSKSPSNGATGVAVNTTVSATFSLLMNGSTLNTSTFKLSGGGGDVSGVVTTNGATATFTPIEQSVV